MKKLSKVEIERDNFSTKVDERNQTIGALRFENNFLAKKTKKLDAKLFQVWEQQERTSSAKLDEMLNIQKYSFGKTWLGIVSSFSTCANSNSACHDIIFVPSCDDTKIDNNASKWKLKLRLKMINRNPS